jgi:hypothetical protein
MQKLYPCIWVNLVCLDSRVDDRYKFDRKNLAMSKLKKNDLNPFPVFDFLTNQQFLRLVYHLRVLVEVL